MWFTQIIQMENGGFTNFEFQRICVGPDTKVLMADSTYEMVSELKRGECIYHIVKYQNW